MVRKRIEKFWMKEENSGKREHEDNGGGGGGEEQRDREHENNGRGGGENGQTEQLENHNHLVAGRSDLSSEMPLNETDNELADRDVANMRSDSITEQLAKRDITEDEEDIPLIKILEKRRMFMLVSDTWLN